MMKCLKSEPFTISRSDDNSKVFGFCDASMRAHVAVVYFSDSNNCVLVAEISPFQNSNHP
jgi:5-methylthioribose kinase